MPNKSNELQHVLHNQFILQSDNTCVDCLSDFTVSTSLNVCVACDANCLTCQNTQTNCTTCNLGSYLYINNRTCGSCNGTNEVISSNNLYCELPGCASFSDCLVCNSGSYRSSSTCQPCASPCAECLSTSTNCTRCLDQTHYMLLSGTARTCVDCTLSGQFVIDQINRKCEFCDSNCSTCSLTDKNCTSCASGFFLVSSTCQPCHATCETCDGTARTNCITCTPGRNLSLDRACHRLCPNSYYYDASLDSCLVCNPECAECSGSSEIDCLTCKTGKYMLSSGSCVSTCPPRSFIEGGTHCSSCHGTCQTCISNSPTDCLVCIEPLFQVSDYTCREACESGWFAGVLRKCEKCHPSCLECAGSQESDCKACHLQQSHFLSSSGKCVDCMNQPETDLSLCHMNQKLILIPATGRAVNANASTSIRICFINESRYLDRLTTQHYLSTILLSIPGLDQQSFTRAMVFREGQAILDLYFGKEVTGTATLTGSVEQHSILLKNKDSGAADLIWRKGESSLSIVLSPAPNLEAIQSLQTAFQSSDKYMKGAGTATPILALLSLFSAGGVAEPLMKFFKIFKMVSRLRLINIDYGVYLEIFLSACNNVFKIGGDDFDLENLRANPQTRGKLDQYRVTVLTSQAVPLQLAVYWLMLVVRFYRQKIRRYVDKPERLTTSDLMLNTMAESGRVLLLTVVGIDLFFYSARCLSHLNKQMHWRTNETASFLMAVLTLLVIPADFALLFASNASCCFSLLRLKMRRQRMISNRLENNQHEKEEDTEKSNLQEINQNVSSSLVKNGLITPALHKPVSTVRQQSLKESKDVTVNRLIGKNQKQPNEDSQQAREDLLQESTLKPKSPRVLHSDSERNMVYFRKRQKSNLSLEQFFGNGIKLHKLRSSAQARFFNSISLAKLFAFEPIYISLQLFPTAQILLLTGLQLSYTAWMCVIGMKLKIFSSRVLYSSALACEIAFSVFMLVGMVFQLGGGEKRFQLRVREVCQFGAMAIMGLSCLVGLVELVLTLVLLPFNYFKNKKLHKYEAYLQQMKEERGLIRFRRANCKDSKPEPQLDPASSKNTQSQSAPAESGLSNPCIRLGKNRLLTRRRHQALLKSTPIKK